MSFLGSPVPGLAWRGHLLVTESKTSVSLGQLIFLFSQVMAFLYTKDKQTKKEIREMTPFTIITNNIIHLGVTLTKQVKDLYDKKFKSLKKDSEENLRRWKDLPCSLIGRINIIKVIILPKAM